MSSELLLWRRLWLLVPNLGWRALAHQYPARLILIQDGDAEDMFSSVRLTGGRDGGQGGPSGGVEDLEHPGIHVPKFTAGNVR